MPLRSADLFYKFDMGLVRAITLVCNEIQKDFPIFAVDIARETLRDQVLTVALKYIRGGWPNIVSTELIPNSRKKYELTVHGDCML